MILDEMLKLTRLRTHDDKAVNSTKPAQNRIIVICNIHRIYNVNMKPIDKLLILISLEPSTKKENSHNNFRTVFFYQFQLLTDRQTDQCSSKCISFNCAIWIV